MKKKLREQLRLLAQRILNEEQSFETAQVKKTTLELYNQLAVLEYLENQIEGTIEIEKSEAINYSKQEEETAVVNEIPEEETPMEIVSEEETTVEESLMEVAIEEEMVVEEAFEEVSFTPEAAEEDPTYEEDFEEASYIPEAAVEEPTYEEEVEIETPSSYETESSMDDFSEEEAMEEEIVSEIEEEVEEKEEPNTVQFTVQNELELFASEFQQMPEFERKEPIPASAAAPTSNPTPVQTQKSIWNKSMEESRAKSLNDVLRRGQSIGLNDRLAFINHLFQGQAEDYSRVMSQINTLESFAEAKTFIEEQIKPDYNNWHDKQEVSERFMVIIEKTFS